MTHEEFLEKEKSRYIAECLNELEKKAPRQGVRYVFANHTTIENEIRELRPVDTIRKYRKMYEKGRISWAEFLGVKQYVMIVF